MAALARLHSWGGGGGAAYGAGSAATQAACRASMCFSSVARYLVVVVGTEHADLVVGAHAHAHAHGVLRLPRLT